MTKLNIQGYGLRGSIRTLKGCLYISALIPFLLLSCSKGFLELAPLDTPSTPNFYKNAEDIKIAVNAAYGSLQAYGQYGGCYYQLAEARSDNTWNENVGGNVPMSELDRFRMTTDNEITETLWANSYTGILLCNTVLDRIGPISMDGSLKNRYTGEVKFLRALMYFNLVRTFGAVPLVLRETRSVQEGYEHGRIAAREVYAQIVADLSDAAQKLPVTYPAADLGRATKGAALALLGKVYLTTGDFEAAVTRLREVVELGVYQLLPDYASLWLPSGENSVESIFEVQYKKGGTRTGSSFYADFLPRNSGSIIAIIGSGLGRHLPTTALINAYEPGDVRKNISISMGYMNNGTFINEPYTLKFQGQPFLEGDADNNWPLLRYADVMLMYAEALNKVNNGPTAVAYSMINEVRRRARLGPVPAGLDVNAFFTAIEHERQVELAFEGHRWFDLVRTGRALTVMNTHFAGAITVQNYELLYPVPRSQIDVNPEGIKQNEGYPN